MIPKVNTYENQYIYSLAERIILMDQQFRTLPGLFDPAREAFYKRRNIEVVVNPDADSSIAHGVEMWFMSKAQGGSPPPPG